MRRSDAHLGWLVATSLVLPVAAEVPTPFSAARSFSPTFSISAGELWKSARDRSRHRLSVLNPSGQAMWSCVLAPPSGCNRVEAWFVGVGRYTFRVSRDENDRDVEVARQEFFADGTEVGFEAAMYLDHAHDPSTLELEALSLVRLLPSLPGVKLEPTWIPESGGKPAYRLTNGSDRTLLGTRTRSNFYGSVERRVESGWVPYPRGGFCGFGGDGVPMQPGEWRGSTEGNFMGEVRPFEPGTYRYVLRYREVAWPDPALALGPTRGAGFRPKYSEVRVATDTFEVPRPTD